MYLEKYILKELEVIRKREDKILNRRRKKENNIDHEIVEKFISIFEKSIRAVLEKREIKNVKDIKDFAILKRFKSYEIFGIRDLSPNKLKNIESDAKRIIKKSKYISAGHGTIAGIGGVTLAIGEIPLFLNHILHSMLKIGLAYGYSNRNVEIINILKILNMFFYPNRDQEKIKLMEESETEDFTDEMYEKYIQDEVKVLSNSFSVEIAKLKLYQGIPLAGGLFGGIGNYNLINSVLDFAHVRYRKKFILGFLEDPIRDLSES